MVSRIMISLRDPTLREPADDDGTVTAPNAGPVSTIVLEDISTTVGTAPEHNP